MCTLSSSQVFIFILVILVKKVVFGVYWNFTSLSDILNIRVQSKKVMGLRRLVSSHNIIRVQRYSSDEYRIQYSMWFDHAQIATSYYYSLKARNL